MNYEMIINKCNRAINIENTLEWNYAFLEINSNNLSEEHLSGINENIETFEKELLNVEKTIKSLAI